MRQFDSMRKKASSNDYTDITGDFEVASQDDLADEGQVVMDEIERWLKDDTGELFLNLAENKKLKGKRFADFQQAFNKLKSLFDEVNELRQAVMQMKENNLPVEDIEEVENQIGEKLKRLEKDMLFVGKEYMDVMRASKESLVE